MLRTIHIRLATKTCHLRRKAVNYSQPKAHPNALRKIGTRAQSRPAQSSPLPNPSGHKLHLWSSDLPRFPSPSIFPKASHTPPAHTPTYPQSKAARPRSMFFPFSQHHPRLSPSPHITIYMTHPLLRVPLLSKTTETHGIGSAPSSRLCGRLHGVGSRSHLRA